MMNKKAIAAFAAGATLLAGFAMATPAFAADKAEAPKKEEKKLTPLEEKQAAVKTAEEGLKKANEAKAAADKKAEDAKTAWEKAKQTVPAKGVETKDQGKTYIAKNDQMNDEERATAQTFLGKQTAVTTTAADAAKAAENVKTADAALKKAQDDLRDYKPDPEVKKSDPSEAKLKGAVVETSAAFDEANGKLEKAYAKYDAAYSDVKAAQAKLDAANAALASFKTAHDEYTKADKVELAQLEKAVRDASEDLNGATNPYSKIKAYNKAKEEFGKAFTAAKTAWSAYKVAFKAAQAKNAELVAGYALPDDLEPLAANYQPGVAHVAPGAAGHAGKPGAAKPGKPGAAAGQAGANGAAAAGSKTEVENKKDKDKRGNTHTGTGVGVTLTALAATMLAGMGAAVRKARH